MVNSQARSSPSGRRDDQRDSARSSVSCTRSSAAAWSRTQRVGVAAQRRDQRFEQGAGIGHRAQSREGHAGKHAPAALPQA